MNVSHFLFNAKAGILDLSRERPISNKGTIDDIRARTEEQLRPAGFPKFSQLGSQNAISAEAKEVLDVNIKTEPTAPVVPVAPVTPPAPGKPILKGQTLKEEPVTPAPAEPAKAPAQKPSIPPPYLLPNQKSILEEYNAYLKERYGEQQALPYVDKVIDDSEAFSALTYTYQALEAQLNKAERMKSMEQIKNGLVDLAKFATTGVADLINKKVGENLGIVNIIKDGINKALDKNKTDAVTAIKQAIDNIFVGRPEMKSKIVVALDKRGDELPDRNKIFEAGEKVREEYKKYKKGELDIGSWKNSQTMGAFEDAYDAYVKKHGKKPQGIGEDPLRWNNGEDDPPLK